MLGIKAERKKRQAGKKTICLARYSENHWVIICADPFRSPVKVGKQAKRNNYFIPCLNLFPRHAEGEFLVRPTKGIVFDEENEWYENISISTSGKQMKVDSYLSSPPESLHYLFLWR